MSSIYTKVATSFTGYICSLVSAKQPTKQFAGSQLHPCMCMAQKPLDFS